MKHAKLSASGSARWLSCPGSVKAEQGIKDKSSPHALEGTVAHELGELALESGKQCSEYADQVLPDSGGLVDTDMVDYVQQYVDYVRAVPGTLLVETRVDFSEWVPDGFGTSDAIVIDGERVTIVDLKYGRGIRVDADNNSQGMLYALGVYSDFGMMYDIKEITIVIVQPRLDHISEWTISVSDLLKWAEWVAERAELAVSGDGVREPSDKACQWCKAKATCPALKDYTEKLLMLDFEDESVELPNVATLSDAQLRQVHESKKLIEGWLSAVEQHISDRLYSGGTFKGYKLVSGRSIRQWSDETEAERILLEAVGDKAHTKKLVSPTQAEKLLGKSGKDKISGVVIKPEGKPTLAPENDKRPAIGIDVSDFD